MATRKAIRPMKRIGLNTTPSLVRKEAASQTFSKGALLCYDGAGYVEQCDSDVLGCIGVADEPGHNAAVGVKSVGMCPSDPTIVFEGSVDTSASLGTGTTAQSQVGLRYGLTLSSGVWYVDTNKTAPEDVRVVVEGLKDEAGTLLGRVYFRFLSM